MLLEPAHTTPHTSHHITPHHTTSHHTTPHYTTSHHTTPHHTTPHHITSHHTTPHYITSHHISSHLITSHHITLHHITSHHTTSHHITHLITSHHTTPHHITLHTSILPWDYMFHEGNHFHGQHTLQGPPCLMSKTALGNTQVDHYKHNQPHPHSHVTDTHILSHTHTPTLPRPFTPHPRNHSSLSLPLSPVRRRHVRCAAKVPPPPSCVPWTGPPLPPPAIAEVSLGTRESGVVGREREGGSEMADSYSNLTTLAHRHLSLKNITQCTPSACTHAYTCTRTSIHAQSHLPINIRLLPLYRGSGLAHCQIVHQL